MVSGTCALMQIFLCRRHVQLLPFVKGFNGQRDLLKWNNLHRWQQSLELVACHCTATLLLVSVTALVRHAVGAEEDLGIAFSGHFFFYTHLQGAFSPVARVKLAWYVDWPLVKMRGRSVFSKTSSPLANLYFRASVVHARLYQPTCTIFVHTRFAKTSTPCVKCSNGPSCCFVSS